MNPHHPPLARPRGRFDAVVMANQPLCREHYLLRVRVRGAFPPTRPGQFVQLGCRQPNGSESSAFWLGRQLDWQPGQRPALSQPELCRQVALLRRPFSLAGRGEDDQGTWLEVIHRVVGVGTQWLANLQVGQPVDLLGPLGNCFDLPPGKSRGLLVGGGVGLPPMFYLAEALAAAGWHAVAFVGAQTRDLLALHLDPAILPDGRGQPNLGVQQFARYNFPTVLSTDDGSLGLAGLITHGLKLFLQTVSSREAAESVIFTCGPHRMMHAVAQLAQDHHVDCQVCMEQAMACGMRTCQSCVVKIDPRPFGCPAQGTTADGRPWRYLLACSDGPVFDARVVVW